MNLDRLRALQIDTLLAGLDMQEKRERIDGYRDRHQNGTAPRAVSSFNLFQTPLEIAARLAGTLPATAKRILEPSAGLGRLWKAGQDRFPASEWVLVEQSPDCCRELYRITEQAQGVTLKQADFLALTLADLGGVPFDAVVMNPPFERGRDVKHIRHALTMLATGGVLVSLCYAGVVQTRELRPIADTWELLPAGSFRSEGTRADVVMLTIRKDG